MDKANNEAKLIAENPDLVPASKAGKLSGCTLAAENIRRELARSFPGIKFSVKSKKFAGGDEVTVRWEDGPTAAEVNKVVMKYRPYGPDVSGDFWDYKPERAAWSEVFGKTRFVLSFRSWSENTERVLVSYFKDHRIENTSDYYWQPEPRALRLFDSSGLPAGAVVTGVQHDAPDDWRITYTLPAPAPAPTPTPTPAPAPKPTTGQADAFVARDGTSFSVTKDRDWTWVVFATKPSASVLAVVRALGARWSAKRAAWYITRPVETSAIERALLSA